jgi:glutathione S-transferase
MENPMKLHYHPISHNCRRVLATIYELGRDDVELNLVDLFQGEHKTPEFLKLNPNGKVPVLVDGDYSLWESTAIMQYLSGDSSLWPASKVRYDIIRWQVWGVGHWGPPIGKIVYERLVKKVTGGGEADEATVSDALGDFQQFAEVLNGHLEGRDWLVGDGITLADVSVAANLTYAPAVGIDLEPYANIRRWYDSIEAREAWKKSAPPPTS